VRCGKILARIILRERLRICMATQDQRREQITVPLDAALRAALERAAKAEHRSVAAQVRFFVQKSLDNQRQGAAA
jgi:hypothetical protein